jgi:thioredoxin-dependent peroxiredoxin
MKLKIGQKAPDFNAKDVFGRQIHLVEYGARKVLIAFFRHAGCPFCNLRVHALTKIHQELKNNGMDMIFFFESKEAVILRSSFHKGVSPVPIISDPNKTWYQAYGLEPSTKGSAISHLTTFIPTVVKAAKTGVPVHMPAEGESLNTMPAEFFIGRNNVIQRIHYSANLTDRLDLEDIKAFSREV